MLEAYIRTGVTLYSRAVLVPFYPLLPLIQKYVPNVENQDRIISDGWKPYADLSKLGYDHSVVCHKDEFVNSEGKHTNSVESVWSELKCWFRNMHGVLPQKYPGYFREFEFRYNNCGGSRAKCWRQIIKALPELH